MAKAMAIVDAFAPTGEPILLLGERGTGKTQLARRIHEASGRGGDFVTCQLAATTDTMIADELFGHSKGAFTGAVGRRLGRVVSAAAGTLFLDELGEANPATQAMLLSLFDPAGVYPVGQDRSLPVTARIIAATNADLVARGKDGRFRADLIDRFGFARVTLPSLRDRRTEILPLFRSTWSQLGPGRPAPDLSPDVVRIFAEAPWRGNLRELDTLVRYLQTMVPDGRITAHHLPDGFETAAPDSGRPTFNDEKMLATLDLVGGNQSEAARLLGVDRKTVARHLKARPAPGTRPPIVPPPPSDMSH